MAVRLRTGHTHVYEDVTSIARGHVHGVVTTTDRAVLLCSGAHVHRIRTLTTFDVEHAHALWTWTGVGIPAGNGQHVHRVCHRTTLNRAHRHLSHGTTATAPNIPVGLKRMVIALHCN